ncbi:MAG: phosphate ABC transporter permease PstA [Streptomycetaceae bacterium]|jgi:phosphate transport system permease protein|nr:MAG: phosphate ABC transporter permease PstA [Streptomycetaceae bacterium]
MSTTITAVPTKPWQASKRERALDTGIFLAAITTSFLVVALTSMKGKLAYFTIFFIAYALLTSVFKATQRGSAAAKDAFVNSLVAIGAIVTVIPVASILDTVLRKGLPGISFNLFTHDMALATPTDPLNNGGLLHAITGTLTMVAIALFLSVPIGILTALYLTEIKGRFTGPIRFLVQAMSGVPSIVAGLFILSAILYPITKAYSGLMGSLSLTILMIPTIARTSEEVLNLIPNELREAGTALGGTQWRTVAMIVLPAARSGLVTAIILGVARIAGETAPILLLTGGGDKVNPNAFSGPMGSLPYYIWKSFNAGSPEAITRAWAGLLVLVGLVLILFTSARYLGSRKVAK